MLIPRDALTIGLVMVFRSDGRIEYVAHVWSAIDKNKLRRLRHCKKNAVYRLIDMSQLKRAQNVLSYHLI